MLFDDRRKTMAAALGLAMLTALLMQDGTPDPARQAPRDGGVEAGVSAGPDRGLTLRDITFTAAPLPPADGPLTMPPAARPTPRGLGSVSGHALRSRLHQTRPTPDMPADVRAPAGLAPPVMPLLGLATGADAGGRPMPGMQERGAVRGPVGGVHETGGGLRAGAEACPVQIDARPRPGAMIALRLTASCHGGRIATIHHAGLTFSLPLDDNGRASLTVPALAASGGIIVTLPDGSAAAQTVRVEGLEGLLRVALASTADAGLALRPGGPDAAFDPLGSSVTTLGAGSGPHARQVQVYSLPLPGAADGARGGHPPLALEAEITRLNCNRTISADVLIRPGGNFPAQTRQIELPIPPCDAIGQRLVLQNVLEALKIAAR